MKQTKIGIMARAWHCQRLTVVVPLSLAIQAATVLHSQFVGINTAAPVLGLRMRFSGILHVNHKNAMAIVNPGERVPFNGKVIDGLALVDEFAQTGVSTHVLLEAREGANIVVAGAMVVEGWLKIQK